MNEIDNWEREIEENFEGERIEIATIEFTESINELNLEHSFKKLGKCVISAYSRDTGRIPHFHIEGVGFRFSCCVQIFTNEFFPHGDHQDVLSNRHQMKDLDKLLRKSRRGITLWEEIRNTWIQSNPPETLPLNYMSIKQPDYTIINMPAKGKNE